jgi:hypothetical protein
VNAEPRSSVWPAFNVNDSSVLVDDPLHQTQSEADAFDIFGARRVCAIKPFKNVR